MTSPEPAGRIRTIPLDLDPALPGLASAVDPVAVVARFERSWPGPGSAPSIRGCVLDRVRWVPGVECLATFRLSLAPSAVHPAETIGVIAVGIDRVSHRLFSADARLPGLSEAADPGVMDRWLGEQLGRAVKCRAVVPITYQPGSRCTLRYELGDGGRETVLYGKVLPGDRTHDLARTIAALGESVVAPLVGFAPGWHLVVQADAGGRSLRDAAAGTPSPDGLARLAQGGGLLARLHARPGPPASQRTLAHDADELQKYLPAAKRASSGQSALLKEGIEAVGSLAGGSSVLSPSHGAFRLDQVQVGAGGPLLIDLDSYCWAEPARDIGNLLAYLRWREIRQPQSRGAVAEVRAAFLAGYRSEAQPPR